MKCSLCNSNTIFFIEIKNRQYNKCNNCAAILMHPKNYYSIENEIARYQEHNNNVNDVGYQKFVNPIVEEVFSSFKSIHKGLDFGCGTGPVITKLLRDQNYDITTYDPFFDNNLKALETTYNYIVCCEVIEHFHRPLKEFKLLSSLLKPNGMLYCMTDLYDSTIDFRNWYYKDDKSHVVFYQKETLEWISKTLNFSKVTFKNRLIVFEK